MDATIKARGAGAHAVAGADGDDGPGVPEAIPRTLRELERRLVVASIDLLWIFPPLIRGRREWGLVAASCFEGMKARRLVTARYSARRTGRGLYLEARCVDQGVAPADRLPRVMEGVARRAPTPLGGPRVVEVGGDSAVFDAYMKDFADELFEEVVKGPP